MRCEAKQIDPENLSRSCGFLTESEREFLLGEWEPDGEQPDSAQEYRKGNEIKIRLRHALADFALVQQYADEDLKTDVIRANADPPIIADHELDHLSGGLVRFAFDAVTDEQLSSSLYDTVEEEGRRLGGLLEAIDKNNQEEAVGLLTSLLGDNIDLDDEGTQEWVEELEGEYRELIG